MRICNTSHTRICRCNLLLPLKMKIKIYIATFFILIFLGKLITIDSNIFGLIFKGNEITFVDPFCPNQKLKSAKETNSFHKYLTLNKIEIDVFCNTIYSINFFKIFTFLKKSNYKKVNYFSFLVDSLFSFKFYPPPKFNF